MKLYQRIKVAGNETAAIKGSISQIPVSQSFVQCLTLTLQFFSGIQNTTQINTFLCEAEGSKIQQVVSVGSNH